MSKSGDVPLREILSKDGLMSGDSSEEEPWSEWSSE